MMSIVIKNEQLTVEIGKPGQYSGSRFDGTGFIHQVTLAAGNHTFCTPESLIAGSGSGGIGLCNEFGIRMPVGYDDVAVGDYFPKVGAGLLQRTDLEPYDFFKEYPIQPYPIQSEHGADYVRYIADPIPHNGYAFRFEKEVRIEGATLTIHYELHNVGEKPVVTNEYVHNFLSIDHHPVGPDYVLHFPEQLVPSHDMTGSVLEFNGQHVSWSKKVDTMFQCNLPGYESDVPYYWELTHKKAGVGLRERGRSPASSVVLWYTSHVLSPEIFVDINVKPGECQRWSRSYDFFTM
jgi:hypothetical protein